LIFGLFRGVSGFFGLNGRDGDGGDKGRVAVNVGVAFGEGAHGGQVIFLQLVGQQAEPPAEHHHIGGGEREREFLRRLVLIVGGIRVGFERVFDQLAGVKATALVVRQVELDAGADELNTPIQPGLQLWAHGSNPTTNGIVAGFS